MGVARCLGLCYSVWERRKDVGIECMQAVAFEVVVVVVTIVKYDDLLLLMLLQLQKSEEKK